MNSLKILIALLALLALLSILHAIGVYQSLYENLTWYDFVTHFLGGVCVGVGALWLYLIYKPQASYVAWTLLWIVFIGISWEVFEYTGGAMRESNYILDTLIDLVMDTGGALLAWAYTKKFVV